VRVKRLAIVCPGRGSYAERQLRSLDADAGHQWIARADELRAAYELPPLSELDRAERFSAAQHLRPANASPLIWLVTMLDAARVLAETDARATCVLGNSMGWYTALGVSGALPFDDAFRLVQEMALLQEAQKGGGQLLYPVVDDEWRADAARASAVRAALAAAGGEAFRSIDLGGYAVLAGSDAGIAALTKSLPPIEVGRNRYPLKLVGHGPYHTPLCNGVAERARATLSELDWRRPNTTLIDGRGRRFTPWSTDPAALRDYTLGAQVTTPYDLTLSVRVALREHAPDELVLLGPGNTLGGVVAQILIAERRLASKTDFERAQAEPNAPVRSLRR